MSPAIAHDSHSTEPVAGSAKTAREPVEGIDYIYAVIDDEDPGAIEARAIKAVGSERLVGVWMTEDQLSYEVGILNLTAEETPGLLKRIKGKVPLKLVNRDVSRGEVDALFAQVNAEATKDLNATSITAYFPNYIKGRVTVMVKPGSAAKVEKQLDTRTDKAKLEASFERSTHAAQTREPVVAKKYAEPTITIIENELQPAENANANPYRAGKHLRVGQNSYNNCTTGYMLKKAPRSMVSLRGIVAKTAPPCISQEKSAATSRTMSSTAQTLPRTTRRCSA